MCLPRQESILLGEKRFPRMSIHGIIIFDYDKTISGSVYCKKYKGGKMKEDRDMILPDGGDDAARTKWDVTWRMPTYSEIRELFDNCKLQYVTISGVACWKLTGLSKKFIILPFAGKKKGDQIEEK